MPILYLIYFQSSFPGAPSQKAFQEHPFWTWSPSQVLPQCTVLLPVIELAYNKSLLSPECKLPQGSDRVEFTWSLQCLAQLLETASAQQMHNEYH